MKLKSQCIVSFIASVALLTSISCNKEEEDSIIGICDIPSYSSTIDSLSFTVNNLSQLKSNSRLFKKEETEEDLKFEKTAILLKVETIKEVTNPIASNSIEDNLITNLLFGKLYACSIAMDIQQKINSIAISLSEPITVHSIQRGANEDINDLFVVDLYWEKEDISVDEFIKLQNKNKGMLGYYGSEIILKLKENIEIKNTTLTLNIDFDTGKDFEFSTDTFKSTEIKIN